MSGAIHSFLELHTPYRVCEEVDDCNTAIEKAKERTCDVILLDVGMSSKPTGIETALAIRQALPQTKIVGFSTGSGQPEAHEVAAAYLDAVLSKKDGLSDLARIVRSLVASTDFGQG